MGIGDIGGSTKRRVEISQLRIEPPPLLHQPPPPPSQLSSAIYRAVLLAAMIGLMYIVLDQSDFYPPLLQISPPSSPEADSAQANPIIERESEDSRFHVFKSEDIASQEGENDENKLELILKKASMKDRKTVIITTVNAAWTAPSSIFDLFLESFKTGNHTQKLLDSLVVAAMDQEAYNRCASLRLHCFALTTDGVDFSGEAKFRSGDFLKMMRTRTDFLRSVLELGYSFIFTDVDVLWLRDPLERLYPDADFQISCDVYLNNSTNRRNYINTGFVYAKSNSKTIRLYKHWVNRGNYFPTKNDQDVLYRITSCSFLDEIGLDIRFLDTAHFSGLCEPSEDLDTVVTMHTNCCTTLENKIHDIKMVMEDWKNYKLGGGPKKWSGLRKCGVRKSTVTEMKARALESVAEPRTSCHGLKPMPNIFPFLF